MNNSSKRLLFFILLTLSIASNAEESAAVNEYIKQGDHAFNSGLYNRALGNYQRAARYDTDQQSLYLKIASTFLRLGNISSALAVVDQILTEDPNQEDALLIKGQVLEGQDNPDEALKLYQQVKQLNPDKSATYYLQANVLRKMDKEEEARRVLVELTDRNQ